MDMRASTGTALARIVKVFGAARPHHIRGKWTCTTCQTLVQAPVAPHIIDKGLPTAGLLAQVQMAKYADHLPLYRQRYLRAPARSTLGQCVALQN